MGNQKFKLSDMIPNAWFYKLKDMTKPPKSHSLAKLKKHRLPPPPAPPSSSPSTKAKTTSLPPQFHPRKSSHFTRDLPLPPPEDPPISPPRISKSFSKSIKPTRKIRTTATATANFPSNLENAPPKSAEHFDIVIGVDDCNYKLLESISDKFNGYDFQLPRIITKPKQSTQEEKPNLPAPVPARRFSGISSAGVRLKINSPRIMGTRKQGQNGKFNGGGGRRSVKKRRSMSESFAVVKSSDDPQRDFRESMVEMIVQNNLRASKDLEDLLACYLSLNSDEYHDVIIKVFKQIWYDLSGLKNQKFVPLWMQK